MHIQYGEDARLRSQAKECWIPFSCHNRVSFPLNTLPAKTQGAVPVEVSFVINIFKSVFMMQDKYIC